MMFAHENLKALRKGNGDYRVTREGEEVATIMKGPGRQFILRMKGVYWRLNEGKRVPSVEGGVTTLWVEGLLNSLKACHEALAQVEK